MVRWRRGRARAVLLVAVSVVLVAGCDSIRSNAEQTFTPNTPGVLTVATTLPAPGFWNQDAHGTFTGGFEYEIAQALAERFGVTLDVVDVPFEDITGGRPPRRRSCPRAGEHHRRARRRTSTSPRPTCRPAPACWPTRRTEIADLKTARARSWCVTRGTTEAQLVDETIRPSAQTLEADDDQACAEAVADGAVDAALLDLSSTTVLQDMYPGLDTVARFATDERYGVVVPNGDDELELIDAAIHALDADGSLRTFAGDWLTTGVDPGRIPVIVAKNRDPATTHDARGPTMHLLNLTSPHGTIWELLVAVLVVIAGPILVERVHIPGLIGLLAGGCIIGPNVLGIASNDTGVLHQLGEIGLLYLMFVAGLELDFGVFARYKRQAAGFTALTFFIPFVFGIVGGLLIDYSLAASILLGSLFASYTLVVYPIVRNMGLASNGAVATAVGATVLTDTMALVVLAAVAGSTSGDANGLELATQIIGGLAILAAFCFLVLPFVAKWFFHTIGRQRTLRYASSWRRSSPRRTLAEVVGIEAIVGAFFAGLALNRMVPNEGDFMEHIEFFGSSLLIPLFLVSVGTVIDPKVLVDPSTLGIAAIFVVACIGGKLLAALLCKPLFAFTGPEVGVVFGMSVAQAAATLAATFVGLQIGLFTTTTVNAVMIVIVVSLVLASMAAQRFGQQIPKPTADAGRIGRVVLAQAADTTDVHGVLEVAARLASNDVGVVRPVFIVADGAPEPDADYHHAIEQAVGQLGIDAELDVRHDRSVNDGVLHASSSFKATLLVVSAATQSWLPTLFGAAQHGLVAASAVPTALVRAGSATPARWCWCSRPRRPSVRPAPRASPRSSPAGCGRADSPWSSWRTPTWPTWCTPRSDGRTRPRSSATPAGWTTTPRPPTSSSCPAGATAR